jgi:hypothetical protein
MFRTGPVDLTGLFFALDFSTNGVSPHLQAPACFTRVAWLNVTDATQSHADSPLPAFVIQSGKQVVIHSDVANQAL